jgi:DNA-binding transcriptional ArsR family regulator
MTYDRPNDVRGRDVRARLLAIIRARAVDRSHIPKNTHLGELLGISAGQVSRHMARLMDEGMLELRSIGRRRYASVGRIAA